MRDKHTDRHTANLGLGIDIGSMLDENGCHVEVAVVGGYVQGGEAALSNNNIHIINNIFVLNNTTNNNILKNINIIIFIFLIIIISQTTEHFKVLFIKYEAFC